MRSMRELMEAVVSKPRNMSLYLRNRIRLIDALLASSAEAKAVIDANIMLGGKELDYFLSKASDREVSWAPEGRDIDLDHRLKLSDLRDTLSSMLTYRPSQFVRYAISTIEHAESMGGIHEATRRALSLMPALDPLMRDYGYTPGHPDTENVEEYQAMRRMIAAYAVIDRCVKQYDALVAEMLPRLRDYQTRDNTYYAEKYRPPHGEIETLYHASAFVTEILRDGFAAEKPEERKGVGNFGSQPEISFTHDYTIAHDIWRAMRIIWMIVHGEVTWNQIVGWIRHENIDLSKASQIRQLLDDPRRDTERTVRLYTTYLFFTKLARNPVFGNVGDIITVMRDRELSDIGIVSCPVRLDGTESYLHGEAEFRVMPDHVVGPIKRVI